MKIKVQVYFYLKVGSQPFHLLIKSTSMKSKQRVWLFKSLSYQCYEGYSRLPTLPECLVFMQWALSTAPHSPHISESNDHSKSTLNQERLTDAELELASCSVSLDRHSVGRIVHRMALFPLKVGVKTIIETFASRLIRRHLISEINTGWHWRTLIHKIFKSW